MLIGICLFNFIKAKFSLDIKKDKFYQINN